MDPVLDLNGDEPFIEFRDESLTRRTFFHRLTEILRMHADLAADSLEETQRKLWSVLSQFEFKAGRDSETVIKELNHLLRGMVDFESQLDSKRRELCGLVMELGAIGNVTISITDFFLRANLLGEPVQNWARIREKQHELVQRQVKKGWNYEEEQDVRSVPKWPEGKSIVVFSGESGQGKTWRLASLALGVFSNRGLAVAVTATGDAALDITHAVRKVWQEAVAHDTDITLHGFTQRYRNVVPHASNPWLTILIDDVVSSNEAIRLVRETDWESLGINLAISTYPSIARSLTVQFTDRVCRIDVEDFSTAELRYFLNGRGQDWAVVHPDVRHTLQRPLLARIYSDVASDSGGSPTSEYDLYERYWNRIRDERNQADHPADLDSMRELALSVVDSATKYPWSRQSMQAAGVTPEVQIRLELIGWLRRLDDNCVEVWHRRLLHWAVAEALVHRHQTGMITTAQLGDQITRVVEPSEDGSRERLGYVPMDALWLLAGENKCEIRDLANLILALEKVDRGTELKRLYHGVLPRLGTRIIPALLERLRLHNGLSDRWLPDYCATTIIQIGRVEPEAAANFGLKLVMDDSADLQDAGLRVLAKCPHQDALDRLWILHQSNVAREDIKGTAGYWESYEYTFAALRSCIRLNPNWLIRQVTELDRSGAPGHELAWLIAGLGQDGAQIWRAVKRQLFSSVPAEKLRSLARCIGEHRDMDEIERLESWLDRTDNMIAEGALQALATIAPQNAIDGLPRVESGSLYMTRNWWMTPLLLEHADKTNEALLRLMKQRPDDLWLLAIVFQDNPNEMDASLVDFLLHDLARLVDAYIEHPPIENDISLWRPFEFLAEITRRDLLQRFEMHSGLPLESGLITLASIWIARSREFSRQLRYLKRVMLMIGGNGFTELTNLELESSDKYVRLHGLESSIIRPNIKTRHELVHISQSAKLWEGVGKPHPWEQSEAAAALAILGENKAVIEYILRWGIVMEDLAVARQNCSPMADQDLSEAFLALDDLDKRPNALKAIAISGRNDVAGRLTDYLRLPDSNETSKNATLYAIWKLGIPDLSSLDLIATQLQTPSNSHFATLAIFEHGGPTGIALLETHLQTTGVTFGSQSEILALNLTHLPHSRQTALKVIWSVISDADFNICMAPLIEQLGELDIAEAREYLIDEAFATDEAFQYGERRISAIRAIAKFDRDLAFHAVEVAFARITKDREMLPELALEIDEVRGIDLVCENSATDLSALVLWGTGRALRRAADRSRVDDRLGQMLRSSDASKRFAACELWGWQWKGNHFRELRQIAKSDESFKVRRAALKALGRRRQEERVVDLLQQLKNTTGIRAWNYVTAVIDSGDPILISDPQDRQWLGGVLPFGAWDYTTKRLKKNAEQLKKTATDEDKELNDT